MLNDYKIIKFKTIYIWKDKTLSEVEKKNLIIIDSSRSFLTNFSGYIKKFSKNFTIVIFLITSSNIIHPRKLVEKLEFWKKNNLIVEFFISPDSNRILNYHLYIKSKANYLKSCNFDVSLSGDEFSIPWRYLHEVIEPLNCKKIIFWPYITYMLMYNQKLSKSLIKNKYKNMNNISDLESYISKDNFFYGLNLRKFKTYLYKGIWFFSKKSFFKIYSLFNMTKKRIRTLLNNKIYPFLLVNKTFKTKKFEALTQIGDGDSDAYFFSDPIEVMVHKNLFDNSNVFLIKSPTGNKCSCTNKDNHLKNKLLCPLSGWEMQTSLDKKILNLYVRDILTVLKHTKLEVAVLRYHPDFINGYGWSKQLFSVLEKNGIKCELQDCSVSIDEIACNYKCIASFASSSLRNLRFSCKNLKIIGFKSISKYYFDDPKFVFGESQGIGWIEEDGSFDPQIFSEKNIFEMNEKDIVQSVEWVLENKIK